MKVAVTGANGFLGHHLLRQLLQENVETRALVHACHASVSDSVFNIGSMRPTNLQELAHNVIQLLRSRSKLIEDTTKQRLSASVALRLVAENTRARRYLDWTPRTNLADGLRLTLGLSD